MTKNRFFPRGLIAVALFLILAFPAGAAPSLPAKPAAPLSLPIAGQLQQQLHDLVGTGTAAPAAAASDEDTEVEPPTFGTKTLNLIITLAEVVRTQGAALAANFAGLPQLSDWLDQQTADQHRHDLWNDVGDDLIYIVGPSLLGALALELAFFPLRRNLQRRRPATFDSKLAIAAGLFLLRAMPVVVFIAASAALLDRSEAHRFPRFIISNIVYALALARLTLAALRSLLAPQAESLRLIPAANIEASYAYGWLGTFGLVIIFGCFCVDVAHVIHLPDAVLTVFENLYALLLVVMTAVVILQKRALVATLLRGNLSAAQPNLSWLASLRLMLARRWHLLAIAYLIVGFAIMALGVSHGFVVMLRGTILSLLILFVMRMLFGATNRWGASDATAGAALHHAILRLLTRGVIWILAALAFAAAWGADLGEMFATPFGHRMLDAMFSIGATVIILAMIYEAFSGMIERHLSRRDEDGTAQISPRMRTLLPMIRNTVFIVAAVVVALVALSEVGVNIGPLLAGAGVLGVAVGFGSQTLVKDFLTGLFIVVENTIAIGDVVQIGTHSGVVDAMSVRTLRLRDSEGALHILPYSEVTQIVNMTRDYAYAVVNVRVAYDTDLEHAMSVIRAVGEELQKDPIFKRVILTPIEVLGVDSLGDSAIILLAQMRTRPGKQWDVKRMLLLRLKQRFDKEKIVIPYPTTISIRKEP